MWKKHSWPKADSIQDHEADINLNPALSMWYVTDVMVWLKATASTTR